MSAESFIASPQWQGAGWAVVHFLWCGGVIGFVSWCGRRMLQSHRPQIRYLWMLANLATLVLSSTALLIVCTQTESLRQPTGWAAVSVPSSDIVTLVPAVWMLGCLVMFAIVSLGFFGTIRLRRQSEVATSKRINAECARLSSALQVTRRVSVTVCDRVSLPALIGIVRPVILLPPAALSGWTPRQIEAVLLHELAHVKRWDNLVMVIQRLVETVLWFHPVVWIVSNWIDREREFCCDDFVIARTGRRFEYAETLAEFAMERQTAPEFAASLGGRHVLARIRRILKREEDPMPTSRLAFAGIVAGLFTGFALWSLMITPRGVAEELADQPVIDRVVETSSGDVVVEPVTTETATSDPTIDAPATPPPATIEFDPVLTRRFGEATPRSAKRAWGPEQAEGPPDTEGAGDIQTAWASQTPDGQAEWLICHYEEAVIPKIVAIHETYNPGAVVKVTVFKEDGEAVVAWEGTDPTPRDEPKGISLIPIKVEFKTNKIKIDIDSEDVSGWNEIDAVGLRDEDGNTQWAKKVDASTTYAEQTPVPIQTVTVTAQQLQEFMALKEEVEKLRKEVERIKELEKQFEEFKKLIENQ